MEDHHQTGILEPDSIELIGIVKAYTDDEAPFFATTLAYGILSTLLGIALII